MADEVELIALPVLKDRLTSRGIPLPMDDGLHRLIRTASGMVIDRCVAFDQSDPPNAVQEATLLLALQMRVAETVHGTDAEGRPIQVKLWTSAITDILGSLIRDSTPEPTVASAGSLGVQRAHPTHSEYRRPLYVGSEWWE